MPELEEYEDANGHSPFGAWFDGLNAEAAGKIAVAVERLAVGNLSNTKSVGGGVFERKI